MNYSITAPLTMKILLLFAASLIWAGFKVFISADRAVSERYLSIASEALDWRWYDWLQRRFGRMALISPGSTIHIWRTGI